MKPDRFYELFLDQGIAPVHLMLAEFVCEKYGKREDRGLFSLVATLSLLFERGHLRVPVDGICDEAGILMLTSPDRERAAIQSLIAELSGSEKLIRDNPEIFRIPADECMEAMALAGDGGSITGCHDAPPHGLSGVDAPAGGRSPFVLPGAGLYITTEKLYLLEKRLTGLLLGLAETETSYRGSSCNNGGGRLISSTVCAMANPDKDSIERKIRELEAGHGISLEKKQREAVIKTFSGKLAMIAGGPGTGKSTLISFIIEAHLSLTLGLAGNIAVAAPTGRAAARLDNLLAGLTADGRIEKPRTVHRLLGIGSSAGEPEIILPHSLVIIDESSMLDAPLFTRLLSSLRSGCVLVLVGDPDQLPSVGAGTVFSDMLSGIDSARHILHRRYVQLDRVKRSGEAISSFAAMIKKGQTVTGSAVLPDVKTDSNGKGNSSTVVLSPVEQKEKHHGGSQITGGNILLMKPDFGGVFNHAAMEFASLARHAAAGRINEALEALNSFALLTPCNSGLLGTDNLNEKLMLHFSGGRKKYFPGMPVMIVRNDYKNSLFNGDRGILVTDDTGLYAMFAMPDGGQRKLPVEMLRNWEVSYAQTVHKSQGNEYDSVALAVEQGASKLLTREIIYTAVTRARHEVVIYCEPDLLDTAIRRNIKRYSGISMSLQRQ